MKNLQKIVVGIFLLLGLALVMPQSASAQCFIATVDRVGFNAALGVEAGHFTSIAINQEGNPVLDNRLLTFNPTGSKSMLAAALTAASLDEQITICLSSDSTQINTLWLRKR